MLSKNTLNDNQRAALELIQTNPVELGRGAGFDLLGDIHNEWIKKFVLSESDVTLQAHRGSYKTTCLSVAMAIMIVIYKAENIIFVRKSADNQKVCTFYAGIRRIYKSITFSVAR